MPSPRVSVIIPVCNRPAELAVAVASLSAEAALIREVIVVDDASAEPVSLAAPPGLDGKLRVIRLETNMGASFARQAGVDAAVGDVVAFLDSDDAWLPGKLAAQLPLLEEGGLAAVACGWQVVNKAGGGGATRMPVGAADPADFAAGCWFCPGSTVVALRSVFDAVGPLDRQLRRLEDLDWFLRFGMAGGRLLVAPVVGALVVREARSNLPAVEIAAARIMEGVSRDPRATPRVRRRLEAWLAVEKAMASHAQGSMLQALALVVKSLALEPRLRIQLGAWWRVGPPVMADAEARRLMGLPPSP
jgi:glycosyltransferase involved in cell wall biosynthesis